MDETRRAWEGVGEGFGKLGRLVSERYHRLGEERAIPEDASDEADSPGAIRNAIDELDRAFTALGDTLRDDAAKQHVRDSGRKLSDALKVTFNEVGEEIRRAMGSRRPPGPDDSPPPAPPPEASA